jgi:hypothetical protein
MAEATGDCFAALGHFAMERIGEGDAEKFTYVHGAVTHPITGMRHVHAWAEIGDARGKALCLNVSTGLRAVYPRAVYYASGCIRESELVKYSANEMMAMMLETEHFGPWDTHLGEVQDAALKALRGDANGLQSE